MLVSGNCWGAELLVITKDGSHYTHAKKGDIVAVRPDGYKWSEKEKSGLFMVVKKPDIKYEDAKQYEQSLTEEVDVVIDGKTEKQQETVRDRKYYVELGVIKTKDLSTEKTLVSSEKALLSEVTVEK